MQTVFVDGLNVAWWCGAPPQLRLPLALLAALRAAGRESRVYFDANAPHVFAQDAATYQALRRQREWCVEAPSGTRADGLMLRQARDEGACLISRDHFRDYRRRYRRLIDDPKRRLAGHVANERLVVAELAIDIVLPASAAAAAQALGLPAETDGGPLPSAIAGPMMTSPI